MPRELTRGLSRVTDYLRASEAKANEVAADLAAEIARRKLIEDGKPLGRAELFRALQAFALPPAVTGILVRDERGRPVAWRGRTYPDATHPPGVGTGILASPAFEVFFTEAGIEGGGRVVAYSPLGLNFPLRNRFLRPETIEEEIARRFGLAGIEIDTRPAEIEPRGAHRRSAPWRSADGREIATVTVTVFPLAVRLARIDEESQRVRVIILTLLFLVVVRVVGAAAVRPGASLWTVLDFSLVLLVARVAVYHIGFPSRVLTGDAFDPASFSYPLEPFGLDLGLLNSPGDLVLTALMVLAFTRVALTWIGRRLELLGVFATPRPRTGLVLFLPAVLAVVIAVAVWVRFLHLLPFFSTVEFFSEQSVLPEAPAVVILLGGFIMTLALLAWTSSILLLPVGLVAGTSERRRLLGLAATVPVLAGAILLLTGQPDFVAPIIAICLGLSAAFLAVWPVLGFGIRLAVFTGVATVLTFPPFLAEVWQETLTDVEEEAADMLRSSAETPLEQRLKDDITEIASDERLITQLRGNPEEPRPDLAFRLWADSPLSGRPQGSDLLILSRSGNRILSRFEIDMPPRAWLPDPLPGRSTAHPLVQPQTGRGRGKRLGFLVGTAPILADDGEYLGHVMTRMPTRRPLLTPARRPEILRSFGGETPGRSVRELYYSEYDGNVLVETTNPYYPRVHRAPAEVAVPILASRGGRMWIRETIGDKSWMNLYRPRYEDGERTGLRSVGFRSRETRGLFLAFFKLLLVNAIAAAAAAVAGILMDVRRLSLKFQQKLLISYLVVSAVPVLLLAEVNRSVARETVEEQMEVSLRAAMRRVTEELKDRNTYAELEERMRGDPTRAELTSVVSNEMLKEVGYRLGHEINLYVTRARDAWGGPLVASSEPGIFATEILPERLPGRAWLHTVLLSREFVSATETIGEYAFLVGYSPILSADGRRAIGVISLPMIYGQDAVDRELARRNSLIFALYILILLVVIFTGMVLARRISSPIERLAEATRRLSAGDLDYRIPHRSRDEFGHLVDSFNRMTEDLRESRETIVRAEKDAAWREMAKQIAHEIKNPLTPMRLSAQHILRAYEDGHEDFEEIFSRGLSTIIRQTESLRRIASEFSAFARLPARNVTEIDPAALAREVAGLYGGTENVTVREEIEATPPVMADREELKRVLVNLASNAMQAMEKRGGTLTIATAAEGGAVRFTVSDTGVGIEPSDMAKLYEPNFSTKTGGTGLGLAISRAVVESSGGSIEVESAVGVGTTVTVRLPAV